MDDGGEVRLARKKGKKRAPPAPAQREAEGSGARGRDRFNALWQDYHDLFQETEEKKRRLKSINKRKLRLLAEVKFLQKKHISYAKDYSQQSQYRLKKRARQTPSPVGNNDGGTGEGPSTSKNTNLDLHHYFLANGEEADCQRYQDHSLPGRLDQAGIDEDIMPNDANFSVCRDTGNSPATDDKRTGAWKDRVAMKV